MSSNTLAKSLAALHATGNLRHVYLQYITTILTLAARKFEGRQTVNRERVAWGRLMLQAISTGHALLKAQELEELTQRIEQLEARLAS